MSKRWSNFHFWVNVYFISSNETHFIALVLTILTLARNHSKCNAKSKYQIWPSFSDPIVHNLALSPVIDGDFLPAEPETLFGNAADIDYIAGVNNMDGHIFATLDIPSINNALVSTPV